MINGKSTKANSEKKTQIVKKCRKKNSNKVINNTLADTTELNYKKQANKAKKAVRSAKRNFEHKIANNIKNDSKSCFIYVRSKTRVKTTVGSLRDDNDVLITSDPKMDELLNDYFASVFTKEKSNNLPAVKLMFSG